MRRNGLAVLNERWSEGLFGCVGLDSELSKIPSGFRQLPIADTIFNFNKWVIDQVAKYVCAVKPNLAFYEEQGPQGMKALLRTCEYLDKHYPQLCRIADAKRGDVGNTAAAYARALFDFYGFDAVTLNPYLGRDAVQPFLNYEDRLCIILCRTSNPGARDFQDIKVSMGSILVNDEPMYRPLYEIVALRVVRDWNKNGNCGFVAGATYPEEAREIRKIAGNGVPLLVPGVGAQTGDLEEAVQAAADENQRSIIVNSSRGVIFADSPAKAAEELCEGIRRALKR